MQTIVTDVRCVCLSVCLSRGSTVCGAFVQPLPNYFGLMFCHHIKYLDSIVTLCYSQQQQDKHFLLCPFISLCCLCHRRLKVTTLYENRNAYVILSQEQVLPRQTLWRPDATVQRPIFPKTSHAITAEATFPTLIRYC